MKKILAAILIIVLVAVLSMAIVFAWDAPEPPNTIVEPIHTSWDAPDPPNPIIVGWDAPDPPNAPRA